ncbi:MAG: hypothetical protein SGJ11_05470 [Phycisphaerae bacterium]|nr:hypothetical protein [Phycisphaerae bacterium]
MTVQDPSSANASAGPAPQQHGSVPRLRLSESQLTPAETAIEVLREVRCKALAMYGPCMAASLTVIHVMARREVETAPWSWSEKARVLAELSRLMGSAAA